MIQVKYTMDFKLIPLSLLVFCTWLPTISSNECTFTEKCTCFQSDEYEYQCPPGDFEMNIKARPDQYVKMFCENNMTSFDLEKFPDIEVGNADYFSMSYCPLPTMSFSEILNKFHMSHPKILIFEGNNSENITITKHVFDGLDELDSLSVMYSTSTLKDDFLANTPHLRKLLLPNNNIYEIGYFFNNTLQLKYLELSRNKIEALPDKVFYNLHELQKLHLWRNNLTKLTADMFVGLHNLLLLELSINRISIISEDVFSGLNKLVNISLKNNELRYIPSGLFQRNYALESVRIGNNPNLQLSDYVFANLTNLKSVNIDESNLTVIPEHLFEGSRNLEDISISKNKLTHLPQNVFKHLSLKKINLAYNNLKYLPDRIFDTLNNLTELYLQYNFIETVNNNVFQNLKNLRVLNLEYNKVFLVGSKAFMNLGKLTAINLSHNRWNYSPPKRDDPQLSALLETYYSPFNACHDLEEINLGSNLIAQVPQDVINSKVNLKKLNLAENFIQTIRIAQFVTVSKHKVEFNLSKNNLTRIDFWGIEDIIAANDGSTNDENIVIILDDNTIDCDCFLFDLVRYNHPRMLNPSIHKKFEIRQKNFNCSNLEQSPVTKVLPDNLSCTVDRDMGCPSYCDCQWKPLDLSVVVDCSYKNLTKIPVISTNAFDENYQKFGYEYNQTVVNLKGNQLVTGPKREFGYENVTRLNLVDNQLTNITWIPPNVEVLRLDNNKIEGLDEDTIAVLENSTSLVKLSLSSNPWKCDCSASSLQSFLMFYYEKVDSTDVICVETGEPLVNIKDLCQVPIALIVALTVFLFFVLVLVTILALYYRYEREIKIYLYAKNLFLWFVSEEDLDKDKTYDVFICYSHKDEHFVVKDLLPVLEKGPKPYKACVHVRDWIPGEFITTQVLNSVQDSKRTMIILSNNFVESEWGLMEFRTAHGQAMKDGRARVIVVIYGDLNENLLDADVKAYFKTNTYVKWGDPWFWEKIRYALPHSRRTHYNNKKHANVMLKIDEKFEFVNSPATPNHTSTPPLCLDPTLLKNNKTSFGVFEDKKSVKVPDGEALLLNG